jgi:hypothetical protein
MQIRSSTQIRPKTPGLPLAIVASLIVLPHCSGENAEAVDPAEQAAPQAVSSAFVHPGILLNKAQLDFTKAKIAARQEPWLSQFNMAKASYSGASYYTPKPRAVVECGASSVPDNGCTDEDNDAVAAYTQAILWYFSGDTKYAKKSIEILNAWSSVLTAHTNYNQYLQAAWVTELMVPAAEILRYTNSGWSSSDIQKFTSMLDRAFLPMVKDLHGQANWLMSITDAKMAIGVFKEDHQLFDQAVSQWRAQVAPLMYMSTDANDAYPNLKGKGYPVPPPGVSWVNTNVTPNNMNTYWHFPGGYESGLEVETCRDINHATMGMNGMVSIAQTALIQGLDLFSEQEQRIVTSYEFNARYFAQQLSTGSVPSWLCGGALLVPDFTNYQVGWELAYSHYAVGKGVAMPYTKAFIDKYVRTDTKRHNSNSVAWATLSFATK